MKRNFLAIVALVLAIGFSAFKMPKASSNSKFTTYYYFEAATTHGDDAKFTNTTAPTYVGSGTSAPTTVCLASDPHHCVIGFSSTQVTASGSGYVLNDNGGSNPQAYVSAAGFRFRLNN